MFTGKVVTFITSVENHSAIDVTDDYTAILKNDADYQKTSIATDAMLVKIATNSNEEYICNLAINNIVASLVNVKTGAIEQKATVTCTDFVSAYALEKAAEEVVNKLFPKEIAEETALEEPKSKEEKKLAEQKAKEEKALAEQKEKEEKALAEQKAKEEKALEEQKAKEERELAERQARMITSGLKVFFDGKVLTKAEVQNVMANTSAINYYSMGIQKAKKGDILMYTGLGLLGVGIVFTAVGSVLYVNADLGYNFVSGHGYEHQYDYDKQDAGLGLLIAGTVGGIGGGTVAGVIGIRLRNKAKQDIQQAVNMYNGIKSTSHVEVGFGVAPNGMSMTVKF
jgi:hypothetical protein